MTWNIAQAKQRFSNLVRQSVAAPQLISNRKRLVAAVIDAEVYRAFLEWSERTGGRTLAAEVAELPQVLSEEDATLASSPMCNQEN